MRDIQYAVLVYERLGADVLLDPSIPFSALKVISSFKRVATRKYLIELYETSPISIKKLTELKDCIYIKDIKEALKVLK